MFVYELFNKIDFETLWKYFYENRMKEENDTPKKIESSKDAHNFAYLNITKIIKDNNIIKNSNNILIPHLYEEKYHDELVSFVDISLYMKDEILENFKTIESFENNFDFSTLSYEELVSFLHDNHGVTSYAFEFSPWKEILGYEINELALKEYGEVETLSAIFYEMTFLGFEEEDIDEEREELERRADEVEEAIENNDMSNFKTVNLDDFDYTPPTKEEMKEEYLQSIENKKILYPYLKEIKNSKKER